MTSALGANHVEPADDAQTQHLSIDRRGRLHDNSDRGLDSA